MWTYVVTFILVCVIILFFALAYNLKNKNDTNATMNILYPFSGYLSPPNQFNPNISKTNPGTGKYPADGLYLVGQVGGERSNVPQIQCPTGYKINIVGAFVEVADPYGECSLTPDPTLQLTCGGTNLTGPDCDSNRPCSQGMTCSAGRCIPSSCYNSSDCSSGGGQIPRCPDGLGSLCSINSDCPGNNLMCLDGKCIMAPGAGTCMACVSNDGTPINDPSGNTGEGPGTCSFMPTCTGLSTDGKNKVCNVSKTSYANDKYRCRPREATAYLAKHCDGKSVCLGSINDMWEPNNIENNPFGPLPCKLTAPEKDEESDYLGLPFISGWGGGAPANSPTGATGDPVTFNQGYYVHGIYTCVPEDENVLTS